ncbi:hypothetical protein SAMN04488074_103399 [Lentzea albidocapillata subsp. violacea]|uniref:Uncharacterized protein n=1 Tax=Lentzea albidocapillata subsp. violacea TaxID=128104 RepID=A0A1G8X759_9PSEU|nr:DUF6098 family protein [Lentzea albidocapillata]SDJ86519.1 hypothetical protein SAMN04488074_103399 [Lentzea albidocapillata subsp. violacea]
MTARLPTITSLAELTGFIGDDVYLRWSQGPEADEASTSRDSLTGVELPGLSASPLHIEPWWGDRSRELWVARRLFDYRHLRDLRGPGVRAWVLRGAEVGRGPDNEPLVRCLDALAWVADSALRECSALVGAQRSDEWGPLDRSNSDH